MKVNFLSDKLNRKYKYVGEGDYKNLWINDEWPKMVTLFQIFEWCWPSLSQEFWTGELKLYRKGDFSNAAKTGLINH